MVIKLQIGGTATKLSETEKWLHKTSEKITQQIQKEETIDKLEED